MKSVVNEHGDYMEPFAVEEAMKFKTPQGVWSLKYETFKAFPGQKRVSMTSASGTSFKAQVFKSAGASN